MKSSLPNEENRSETTLCYTVYIQIFIAIFFPFLAQCDLQAYVQFGMYHDEWDGTCNVCGGPIAIG